MKEATLHGSAALPFVDVRLIPDGHSRPRVDEEMIRRVERKKLHDKSVSSTKIQLHMLTFRPHSPHMRYGQTIRTEYGLQITVTESFECRQLGGVLLVHLVDTGERVFTR